jgi:peptidoglycan/LPS O-acetylase OafA/YrhL
LPIIFGVVAIVVAMLRLRTSLSVPFSNQAYWFPTHLRMDSLFFGVLLASYYYTSPGFVARATRARWAVLSVSLVLLVASQNLPGQVFRYVFGPSLVYMGFGGVVLASMCMAPPERGMLRTPLIVAGFIGSFSYSIYLWHTAVSVFGRIFVRKLLAHDLPYYSSVSAFIVTSVIFGIVASKAVEMPVLALRDRFFPSKTSGLEPAERPFVADAGAALSP